MKTEPLSYAVIGGGVIALAWLLSTVRFAIGAESILGYAAVGGIVALLVSEYRVKPKNLTGK